MLYWELKFLSRQFDFTLGIGIDAYFPLKAGKEKWVYNRKQYVRLCLSQAFLNDGKVAGKGQVVEKLNFATVLLP